MKVTIFVLLQSQNLKNVKLLQNRKMYLFEIQSTPNLNLHLGVKQTNLTMGRLATPSSRLRPNFLYEYIFYMSIFFQGRSQGVTS
jgi:hypothetical protein